MRRPRRQAEVGGRRWVRAPLMSEVAAGVTDEEGAPVIGVDCKNEGLLLGFSVVAGAGDWSGDGATLNVGVAAGVHDSTGWKDGVPVRGAQAVAAVVGKGNASTVGAITVKGIDKVETDEEGVKWLKHYSSTQSILIVGDGDFSFSLALATAFGSGDNLVATSLDSYELLIGKYSKAELNVKNLLRLGAIVLHDVDAKKMKHHTYLKTRWFDRIIFNFPHAGFHGREDDLHVINLHKKLLSGFFSNTWHLLRSNGETHVSHKIGYPYDAWGIDQLAYESSLIVVDVAAFHKEDYPGYNQKRGDKAKCDQPFTLGRCCTFKFCIRDVKKSKKILGNSIDPISSFGGSDIYPGTLAIDRRPLDLFPLTPVWSRLSHPANTALPFDHGVTQKESPCLHQNTFQPIFSFPVPALNVLPTFGGIPSMERITNMTSPAPLEQPWYEASDYSNIAWEHQSDLHREYDIRRRAMPTGTSLDYLNFLEDSYRESVKRRIHLERLIARYSGL